MDFLEAIARRHSVRKYTDRPIEGAVLASLEDVIGRCNEESGMNITLCLDNPEAFDSRLAHYGSFEGVRNHVALVGKKGPALDEAAGYYGELVALSAQALGLNTCWVAMTYKKKASKAVIAADEACPCVLAIGYGETQGESHALKPVEKLCRCDEDPMPDWFVAGMEAARLAPTAVNQQRFLIELERGRVSARALIGPCSRIDLGIVKRHFEIGARSVDPDWSWSR